MLNIGSGTRERRLLSALLILGVVFLFFGIVSQLSLLFFYFGDILLTFFLAWLLAFIISPIVTGIVNMIPRLPRAVATVLVYGAVVVVLVLVVVVAAGALATSIAQFAAQIPDIKANLPTILAPWQQWLDSIGLNQIDLVAQAEAALGNLDQIAAALVQPLQQIAVASLSVVGTLLIVFFLSIYMVLDRDAVLTFLFRIVPPAYAEEARLVEVAVSRSFGGFLRGQALMGAVYFLIALGTNLILMLPLAALTSVASGLLQMIPFFGPFVSWAPVVIVALVLQPESTLPGDHPDGRRLVRGHERAPAADHAGRRRHPPDRGPRLGPHRRPHRGHPRAPSSASRSRPSARHSSSSSCIAPRATGRSRDVRRAASRNVMAARSGSPVSRRPAAPPTSASPATMSPTPRPPTP